ncbi:MAG: T9SS type A sorting domain-containing protein [Rhodothermales bacterium]|nr:T9SS type A sorting domain-containing protein [Rhodothermales bacterium]
MNKLVTALLLGVTIFGAKPVEAQHSVARQWNEALLDAIRIDTPRPTVHSRNLFHSSVAMYDAWSAYDGTALPYMLGHSQYGIDCAYSYPDLSGSSAADVDETVSYAAYRVLSHRFENSPGSATSLANFDALMGTMGYDVNFTSDDYESDGPAALGNYIAQCVIDHGHLDYSNEGGNYTYSDDYYKPYNTPMDPNLSGTQGGVLDINRWQPLTPVTNNTQRFLHPNWGDVYGFALTSDDLTIRSRDGYDYHMYYDPGMPPLMNPNIGGMDDDFKWAFALVAVWSSHLDPNNGVMWDISPGGKGNSPPLPTTIEGLRAHYNLIDGGQAGEGRDVNPATGLPYDEQLVPLGDFARVLSEFWADGPASETPPGHWYTLLNYVNDHPDLEKRFRGEGEILDDLAWDVKGYLALGGAMHDAAIATWAAKGYYDYIRPVSAIRAMGEYGQSSDPGLPSYHPFGLPLIDDHIAIVESGDPLAGVGDENVGKIKLYAWKGHGYIPDPETDVAGVDWILSEDWWPYQKHSFVTPPFAGYTSGHSAFSRAGAEVLTMLTGDEYFPGGMGEFHAAQNSFLGFEDGPSVDVTLQWATYRDASDEASLSRLWGGIHPPVDDVPGRLIGKQAGTNAFLRAEQYFMGASPVAVDPQPIAGTSGVSAYPNPVRSGQPLTVDVRVQSSDVIVSVYNIVGRMVATENLSVRDGSDNLTLDTSDYASGIYLIKVAGDHVNETSRFVVVN